MYCFMNFLLLSCRSHSTDSSLVSSKNFDPVGRGEEAGGGRGREEVWSERREEGGKENETVFLNLFCFKKPETARDRIR